MKKTIANIVNKTNAIVVLLSLIIFMSFIIFILPQESAKSEAFGLMESIDTSFIYTADDLYRIAESYGEEGRAFYIRQRFTFDLIWPIAYTQFILIASAYFYKKNEAAQSFEFTLCFTDCGRIRLSGKHHDINSSISLSSNNPDHCRCGRNHDFTQVVNFVPGVYDSCSFNDHRHLYAIETAIYSMTSIFSISNVFKSMK